MKTKTGKKIIVQHTTWKDKKPVPFTHATAIGSSKAVYDMHTNKVRCQIKGKKRRVELDAPQIQKEYAANFSAVDRNDLDSSDYSTTICTDCWYLCLFFWVLDQVINVIFAVV